MTVVDDQIKALGFSISDRHPIDDLFYVVYYRDITETYVDGTLAQSGNVYIQHVFIRKHRGESNATTLHTYVTLHQGLGYTRISDHLGLTVEELTTFINKIHMLEEANNNED